MILYCFLLLLTGVATVLALGWVSGKFGDGEKDAGVASGALSDMAIYREQMAEIETEKKQGLLNDESAGEARIELARRMLDAERKMGRARPVTRPAGARTRAYRVFLGCAVLFIPLFSWGVYGFTGSPGLPAHPFSMLLARDPARLDDAEQLVRAEVLSSRSPRDGRLVDALAGLYLAAGRFQDAVNTYNRAIAMNGQSATRLLGYATALTGFEGGVVSHDAEQAFREAARLDPQNPDARIFLARGLIQNGKKVEAIGLLEDFLQTVPASAPWRGDLANVVEQLKKDARAGPGRQDATITPQQRRFIADNIDKLAARLATKPDDLQGWLMLINAHLALGQDAAAKGAVQKGLRALPAQDARRLAAFAHERGLGGDGKSGREKQTEKTVE